MKRKLVSLLLLICMILSLIPAFSVQANPIDPDQYFYAGNLKYTNPATITTTTTINYSIILSKIDNIRSFSMNFHYDPTIFKVYSVNMPSEGLDTFFYDSFGGTGGIVDITGFISRAFYDPDIYTIPELMPDPFVVCTIRLRSLVANPPPGRHSFSLSNVQVQGSSNLIQIAPEQLGTVTFGTWTGPCVFPTITWPTISDCTYGQTFADALGNDGSAVHPTTLAVVPGTFSIQDATATPNIGSYSKIITFTPVDTQSYTSVTTTVTVNVNPLPIPPPLNVTKTKNTVTITPVEGAVYGLKLKNATGAVTYGSSNVFTGLRPNTIYTAYIKSAESESPVAFADVTTDPRPVPINRTFDKVNLNKPTSIDVKGVSDAAIDLQGNIFVADSMNSRILKYDVTGTLLATYGSMGDGEGQFNTPVGLVISGDDIYVADTYNSRIVKFTDPNGDGVIDSWTSWGSYGNGLFQFKRPAGLFVKDTKVYVADTYNHRIAIFDTTDGGFWTVYGSKGTGDSGFFYPMDIAVDAIGDIWVADVYNNAIKQLSAAGEFITSYAAALPYGVAIDSEGNVYTTQRTSGTVICVTNSAVYGGKGNLANQFVNPTGITFDADDNMWVVDVTTNTVKKAII